MTDTHSKANAAAPVSFDTELAAIADRRKQYGLPLPDDDHPACGLAISGGGIRSATFGLGVLRGLSTAGVLPRIDYLSTVSGGGYIGAFYCGLFVRRGITPGVIAPPLPAADLLGSTDALRSIAYLRQAGRFLAPNGGRDLVFALALLVRNWLALTLVVGVAIVFGELVLDVLRYVGTRLPGVRGISIWLSPMLGALGVALVLALASGWGYWLSLRTLRGPKGREWLISPPLVGTVLIVAATGTALLPSVHGGLSALALPWLVRIGAKLIAVIALIALAVNALAIWLEHGDEGVLVGLPSLYRRATPGELSALFTRDDRVRNRLSAWQGNLAAWALIFVVLSLADAASFALLWANARYHGPSGLWALAYPLLAPQAQKLLKSIDARIKTAAPTQQDSAITRFAGPLTALVALAFAAMAMAIWGFAAHALVFGLESGVPATWPTRWPRAATLGLIAASVFVALASLTSGFINLSSLASFYANRLRSAYLGASNPVRVGEGSERGLSVYATDANDDLSLRHYYAGAGKSGAPVHIINVTINETRGKGPQTVQKDRHGINMAISPQGMIYNAVPGADPAIKPLGQGVPGAAPGQRLPLSAWIGISGAAFSTGLGQDTSTAKSVLAFLTNVRLGCWWRADIDRPHPAPTYINIVRELFASFPGTDAREWYLTDGGHFENTAVYELIRRNVPFVVVADNGCDPHYVYDDIANLVRKARIDFRAEIEFLASAELDLRFAGDPALRPLFANPRDFNTTAAATALAMLAHITYSDGTRGTLLVIKPKRNQWLPEDITSYAAAHADFPQQSTLNQFFSEDQWESYEKLGWLITQKLFQAQSATGLWSPAAMQPLR